MLGGMRSLVQALGLVAVFAFGQVSACKKEEPETAKKDKDKDDDDDKGKKKKKQKDDEEKSEDKGEKAKSKDDDDDKGKKKKKIGGECPSSFKDFPEHDSADEQACTCAEDKTGGAVWGTEIFTEDSSPCAAAVHAGVIKASGGDIAMKHAKGCDSYAGSTKNGVTTHGWGKYAGSFYFPDKGDGKCKKSDACPATFKDLKDKTDETEVTCTCAANPSGAVWGSDIYTQDSSICNAAVHNGVVTKADGGSVTAKAAPGCKSYSGSTTNGVTTSPWGDYETSFFFPSKGDGICKSPKVVTASKYKMGDGVDVLWNGAWYEGTVLAVATGDKYRIHYSGYASSWDEWVTLARIRAKTGKGLKGGAAATTPTATASAAPSGTAQLVPVAGAYAVGDAVNVLWKGSWYPGKIIGVNAGQYKVHYDGYASSWDEWVGPARLKKK